MILRSLFLMCLAGSIGKATQPLSEIVARQWLNEHVIAVNNDGTAIEPYDFVGGWNLGLPCFHAIEHHVPAHLTPLQVCADGQDGTDPEKAFKALGMRMPSIEQRRNRFVFGDFVVPHLLAKAQASGKPIVIFAHGGLNYLHQAIQRAAMDGPIAEKDCYPIFICWNSSFGSSYFDHLLHIRNGVNIADDNRTWAYATAPVYLATDVATSIVRFPRTLLDLTRSSLKGSSFPNPHNDSEFGDVQDATVRYYALRKAARVGIGPGEIEEHERFSKKLGNSFDKAATDLAADWRQIRDRDRHHDWSPITVSKGPFVPAWGDSLTRTIGYVVFSPFKFSIIAGLSGAGEDMWDVMSRRTQVMYHYEASFRPAIGSSHAHTRYRETNPDTRYSESTGIGCMAVFLRKLEAAQHQGRCLRITAVGHSMGAMVFDEALREFPGVRYDTVVYLAAACTARDFYDTALPYLSQSGNRTEFYGITLHPRAEDRDRMMGEFAPRGSLLVWIDEFLNHPKSFTDRTFGQFENALLVSRMFPPHLQGRIHLTALSAGPSQDALQSHGDFSSYQFWNPEFYTLPGDRHRTNPHHRPSTPFDLDKAVEVDNARRYLPAKY